MLTLKRTTEQKSFHPCQLALAALAPVLMVLALVLMALAHVLMVLALVRLILTFLDREGTGSAADGTSTI